MFAKKQGLNPTYGQLASVRVEGSSSATRKRQDLAAEGAMKGIPCL